MKKTQLKNFKHSLPRLLTLYFIISVLLLGSAYGEEQKKDFKIGYFIYPPHVFVTGKNQPPTGPLVSFLTEHFVSKMNVNALWKRMPIKRAGVSAKNCKIDMVIIMGRSPEREKFVFYPDKAIHHMEPSILVKKDFPKDKISSSEDLFDQIIGWSSGLPKSGIKSYWDHPRVTLKLTSGDDFYDRNMKMILKNRLTGMASSNRESLVFTAQKYKVSDKMKIIPLPQPARIAYNTFSKCSQEFFEQYQKISTDLVNNEFNGEPMHTYYRGYLERYLKDPKNKKIFQ